MSIDREIALIKMSMGGDHKAFSMLVKIYKNKLFGYLIKICGNREAASDLLQDVLIKCWNGMRNYNEQNKFASWLFSIAHNTAVDAIRKNKIKSVEISSEEIEYGNSSDNPYNTVIHNETKMIIERIVNELPQKQKEVFLLRTHGGMTFKEISDLMKQPLNTVLSHMHYAVKKLRKELKVNYE